MPTAPLRLTSRGWPRCGAGCSCRTACCSRGPTTSAPGDRTQLTRRRASASCGTRHPGWRRLGRDQGEPVFALGVDLVAGHRPFHRRRDPPTRARPAEPTRLHRLLHQGRRVVHRRGRVARATEPRLRRRPVRADGGPVRVRRGRPVRPAERPHLGQRTGDPHLRRLRGPPRRGYPVTRLSQQASGAHVHRRHINPTRV
jgi:hypothetical protein